MEYKLNKQYFKPAMKRLSEFQTVGKGNSIASPISSAAGKLLMESFDEKQLEAYGLNETMRESILNENVEEIRTFSEDNNMANSSSWYTAVMAKFVFYKAWDKYNDILQMAVNYTPADLGMPEGAGTYKIPKVVGGTAVKLSSGQVVNYTNNGSSEATLETETFGIGTRVNHRLITRAAKGVIQKLLQAGSESVLRAIATDVINSIITGASSANTVAAGVSYDAIEAAKKNINAAKNAKGELFGFNADKVAFSTDGWYTYSTSTEFKTMTERDIRVNSSEALRTSYKVLNDLMAIRAPVITAKKNSKTVHAVVIDSMWGAGFLKEDMGTVDGRLPGTLDQESIAYADAGIVITGAEAIAVITEA